MAMYELEERIYFDGGLPADIAEVQEDPSEQNLENNDTAEYNYESGYENAPSSENVSIAPEPHSYEYSGDSTGNNSNNEQESGTSDNLSIGSTFSELVHQSLGDVGAIETDDIAAIIDSIDDLTITDDILSDQNFVIVSSDNENLHEISDSLNDNTTLITYNSDDTFDSIIQKLKEELGDSKAVNIGILDTNFNEQLKVNSEKCTEFLDELKDLQYFDGDINLLCTVDAVNSDTTSSEFTVSTLSTDLNGDWTTAEDSDNDDLVEYFSTDSDFLSTDNQELSTNHEVVFINSSVMNPEEIVDDLSPDAEVVFLTKGVDGIQQITDYLADKTDIETVRIISHGNEGYFVLNGQIIDGSYVTEHADLFADWGDAMSENGDIMLYGCDLAANAEGQDIVQHIADLTGADVAAATHATGGETESPLITGFAGDVLPSTINYQLSTINSSWNLDFSVGAIESSQLDIHGYEYHLANQTVTDNGDSGDGTLRQAITDVGDGEEITFNITSYTGDNKDIITILSELSISGKGMTIDGYDNATGHNVTVQVTTPGTSTYRVFDIDASGKTVTIENMTIKGGNISGGVAADGYGGAIYIANGTVNLDYVTVSNSYAYSGGGIYNTGTLNISDSTISSNYATGDGGGIYNVGTINSISGSLISGNTADGSGGGIMNNNAGVTILNSTIYSNSAGSNGGGIASSGDSPFVTITDTTISGNTAATYGGIYFDSAVGGTLTLCNSIIASNTNGDLNILEHSTLDDNGYNVVQSINDPSLLTEASDIYYGYYAPYSSNWWVTDNGDTLLDNQTLDLDDELDDNGGFTQTLAVTGAINGFLVTAQAYGYTANQIDQRGYYRTEGVVTRGAYQYNGIVAKTAGDWTTGTTYSTIADAYAAVSDEGTITLADTAILESGIAFDSSKTVTVQGGGAGTTYVQAAAPDGSASDRVFNITAGTVTLEDMTIQNGNTGSAGGGIYVNSSSIIVHLTLSSVDVTNNITSTFYGGGIYAGENSTVIIENSTIENNDTGQYGGGIFTAGSLTVTNSTICNNTGYSSGMGGGISAHTGSNVILTNSTIYGNTASQAGGGIYINDATAVITDTTITANYGGGGGGIVNAGTASITNSIIAYNTSDSGNDDIYNNTDPTDIPAGTLNGNYNIAGVFSAGEWNTGGNNTSFDYDSPGALFVMSEGTPVLADNGGSTYTVALADGSIAIEAGCYTGTYNSGANYAFSSNGSDWLKVEDGTPVGEAVTQITTDQRGITITGTPCIGSYNTQGSSATYYMAKVDGNWSSYGTVWFTSTTESTDPDDYTTQATEAPDADNSVGIIINDDIAVTITTDSGNFSIDQTKINSGASITVNDDVTLTVADDGTAATDLDAAGSIIVDNDSSAGTLLIASSAAVDSNGTFTVNGELSFDDSGDNDGTLTLAGASITIASLTAGSGTIAYDGAVSQSVSALTYYNLTISGGGSNIKTLNAGSTTTVSNNLTVDASTELAVGAQTINLTETSATTDINGELSISTGTVDADGTFDATGGTIDFTDAGNLKLGGANITSLGSLDISKGTVWYDREGAQAVLADSYYDLKIYGSGTKSIASGTITVNGDFTVSAEGENDVTFSVSDSTTVQVAHTSTISESLEIAGTGEFESNGDFNATGGSVTFDDTGTLYIVDTVTSLGTLSGIDGTVVYSDTDAGQEVFSDTYNCNLTLTSGAKTISDDLAVGGNLNVNLTGSTTSFDTDSYSVEVAGSTTVTSGKLTVTSGSFTTTGTTDIHGTLQVNTGTYTADGDTDFTDSSGILRVVTGNYIANGAFDATGGTIDFVNEGNLKLAGATVTSLGALDTAHGNVWYNRAGAQTVLATDYYSLTIDGSGTKTLASGITRSYGNLTVSAGTLDVGANTLNVANNTDIDGTLSIGSGTIDSEGVFDATGGNLTFTDDGNLKLGGATITSLGTLSTDRGTVWYDRAGTQTVLADTYYNLEISGSGTKSLGGTVNVSNDLTVSGGTLSVGVETLNVTGNSAIDSGKILSISTGTVDANGTFDATGATIDFTDAGNLKLGGATITSLGTLSNDYGTVWYDRAGTQTVLADTYYGLRISGGSDSTKTLGGAVDVNGDFTIDASTILDTDSSNSYAVNVAGNWTNSGTFNANSGTVTFDSSGTSVISGTTTFNNFTCVTAGKTLTFATGPGNLQTVSGTFTLTGSDGNNIIINSDSTGIQAEISVTNFSVSYVAVQDSNNSSGTDIEASNSTDSGNNTGWSFVVSSYYYMAKVTGNWSSYNTVWFTSATASTDPDDYTTQATEAPDADNSIGIIINDDIAVTITTDSGNFSIDQTTINSGASITVNDDITLTVADDGTGATDLDAAGSIIVDNDSSAGTLLIASGAAVDSNGTFTVNGELSFDDSGDNNGTLTLAGASINIASLTAGSGTIAYDGAVSQSVSALTYYNLTISGGGSNIKTLNAGSTTTVSNNFTVDASTELAVGAQTLNLTGTSATTDINGELSISTGTVDADGTFDATGGTIDFTDAGNLKLGGAVVTSLGTLSSDYGTVWYDRADSQTVLADTYYGLRISGGSDSTKTLGGAVDVNGDLTIDASTIFDTDSSNSYAVNVAGNWTKNGTFNANSGTVTFDGSAAQALSGNNTFYNLTINNSSPDEEVTVSGTLTVTNCLTITDGTFVSASTYEDVIIEEGGSLVLDNNVTVSGNWTNDGTFTSGDNNVTFNGAGAQTITASGTGGFSSLTYSGTGILNLSGTVTVTDLTIDPGTSVNLGDSTLSLGGTASIGQGATIDVSEGTIDYTGTDQTILGTTYKNLSFTGSGTNEIGGNITVTGTFELGSGVTVNASGYTLTYGATATLKYSGSEEMDTTDFEFPDNNGPFNLEIANTAGVTLHEVRTIAGSLTIDEDGALNLTTHKLTVNGTTTMESGSLLNITDANWSSGAFTANGGTVDYKGTAQDIFGYSYFNLTLSGSGMRTLTGDITVQNDLLTGSDVIFDSNDKNLNIGGDWTNSGLFTAGSGMVTYNGTDQNIADISYTHLTVSGAGMKTASTGLSVSNDLTVAEESTLDMNGSFSLNGTLDNSGTIQAASTVSLAGDTTVGGTFIYDGSDQTIAWALSYNNLTISGTGIKTVSADTELTVEDTLRISEDLLLDVNGSFSLNGTLDNSGTIQAASTVSLAGDTTVGGTFIYDGSDQTIARVLSYNNLTISGTGTKTIAADETITVSGTFTLDGSLNLETGTGGVAGTTTLNLNGTVTDSSGTFTSGDNSLVSYGGADQTVIDGTYYDVSFSGSGTKTLGGNITVNNDFTLNDVDVTIAVGSKTLTVSGDMNVSSGSVTIGNGGEIKLAGAENDLGTFTAGTGSTVEYNGTLAQTVLVEIYYNLVIDNGNTNAKTLDGDITINGDLTIAEDAKLDVSSNNCEISLKGDFSNSGTFTARAGTVILNGTAEQQINGNGDNNAFYNLDLSNSSGALLTGNLTVGNELILSSGLLTLGAYRLTLNSDATIGGTPSSSKMIVTNSTGKLRKKFSGNGSFLFPIGTNSSTAQYTPVTVLFNSGISSEKYVDVRVVNSKEPNNTSTTNYLNRYWMVDTNATGFNADITCKYLQSDVVGTENQIYFGEYVNSSWTKYNPANTSNHTITGNGLTSFCNITGINNASPTPTPTRPDVNNGEMINDGTQTQTYTSWRTSIDNGASDSIDSDEGFEPNEVEGIGLMLQSLITFDVSVESVANGEYGVGTGSGALGSGIAYDGEYGINANSGSMVNGEYGVGNSSSIEQEFDFGYDGIVDLTFNFESNTDLINHEAIAAYNERHPLFKTELDLLLEKI